MNYGKRGARKRKDAFSRSVSARHHRTVLVLKIVMIVFLAVVAAVICSGVIFIASVIREAPAIDAMDASPSGYMSTVLDTDGNVTAELVSSGSNRIYASIDEIPKYLQDAFVAIEDSRFYEHHGIDVKGILRAGVKGLTSGNFSEGASTLTQQLLKNNVFDNWTNETNIERIKRKIQEQYLALQLEKQVSKSWILENYLNTINLGQNTLGVQSASRRYFGKDVSDLTLSESAVLAAITQNPSRYNPLTHPDENRKRRAKVLRDMLKQKYISQEEYEEALKDDVYARIQLYDSEEYTGNVTSYFVDALTKEVLSDLQTELGYTESQAYDALYRGGLTVYSTQDSRIQEVCDTEANDSANYAGAEKVSFSYALTVEYDDGETVNYSEQSLIRYFKEKTGNSTYSINYSTEEEAQNAVNTYRESVLDKGGRVLGENLTFIKEPQVSVTVMDQSTGEVKAIVGGRGQKSGSLILNRATDTQRQPGSTFKIVSVYAPAIDSGQYTLASAVLDEPYAYETGQKIQNSDHRYRGWTSIRSAITNSVNVVAVKTLTDISLEKGYDYLQKFGFTTVTEDDMTQAMALGGLTHGVKNIELNGAFSAIANGGIYKEPSLYTKIVDHDGNILLEKEPESHRVIKESTAYLLTSAMQDVIKSGTGVAANFSGMSIAGKTGTTNENRNAWFAGYSPYYTCVVWGGYDDNSSLTSTRYPRVIWKKIMEQLNSGKTDVGFQRPDNIVQETVCSVSGMKPVKNLCSETYTEYFAQGTQPEQECSTHVRTTVCTESGMLAGKYCPLRLKKYGVFVKVPGNTDTGQITEENLVRDSICTVHTEDSDRGFLGNIFENIDSYIHGNEGE